MQKNSIENFISDPDFEWFAESLKKKNSISTLKRSLLKINELLKNRFTQNNDDIRFLIHLQSITTDSYIRRTHHKKQKINTIITDKKSIKN